MFESLHEWWYRLRARFHRDALDSELAQELNAHREFLEDEARARGASSEEARRSAARRLGNTTAIREHARDWWAFAWMEAVLQDTRYALRFLRRSPGFTAVAVLSLALGIGANATVFTVADKLLFSAPAHVADASHLYVMQVQRLFNPTDDRPFDAVVTFPEYFALRAQAKSFATLALYTRATRVRLGRGPDALRIQESVVSTNFFDALRVHPARGRFLQESDDTPAADNAAVISYSFWQRQFAGADSAVGARLITSGVHFVVVGIAPPEFTGVELNAADVWVPLGAVAAERFGAEWKTWYGFVPKAIVRLQAGVLPSAAAAEATTILRNVADEPRNGAAQETVQLGAITKAQRPGGASAEVQVSTRMVIASALVLLAACANLASLLLVRAITRQREIALRLAVGITRARLIGQMVIESLILALAGALAALFLAHWTGAALRTMVFPEMQWGSGTVSVRVFVFSALCGTAVALVATIVPALRFTRVNVAVALRSAAPQLTSSAGRLRQVLLALQVALSVLLIVGATAFGRSLKAVYAFDMGVDVSQLITARFSFEGDSLTPVSRLATLEEAARRAMLVPGVERAAVAAVVPLTGSTNARFSIPERELPPTTYAMRWEVTPELQQTMGFRLTRGRFMTTADVRDSRAAPILLSETGAKQLWPGQDPIGRCVRFGADTAPCRPVVGIIRDLRARSVRDEAWTSALVGTSKPSVGGLFSGYVVIRTQPDANHEFVVAAVRRSLLTVRSDLSSIEVQPLAKALERDYRPIRMGTITFCSFAILAIVLAAIGLYGILAFSVAQRTTEFGIRSALGARSAHLVARVVREGLLVVFVGIVAGIALSWYVSTTIAALLFESSARDALPYVVATGILALVALGASAVPAWRAARVDPATALRAE